MARVIRHGALGACLCMVAVSCGSATGSATPPSVTSTTGVGERVVIPASHGYRFVHRPHVYVSSATDGKESFETLQAVAVLNRRLPANRFRTEGGLTLNGVAIDGVLDTQAPGGRCYILGSVDEVPHLPHPRPGMYVTLEVLIRIACPSCERA